MKAGYTPEQGRGFVRPGETEKPCYRVFSDIKKAAPIRNRLSEQLTCCTKNKYEQGNYINRVTKHHNCRITGKTKATCYGGHSTQATRYPQRMSTDYYAVITSGWQCDQCAGLLVGCQPLGSIPRCCNSLRSIRLIQVANEVSPSALAASSSCALNSSGSRIWYGGDRFSNGVDMVITLNYYSYMVITIVLTITQKTTPRTVGAVTGRLTTNDSRSIEVAMRNHTTHPQGRDSHNLNKYIWRFIALSTAQPRVITIEATSEQEARQQSPDDCVMVFAARIRQGVRHA
ncbi:TPA: host cell division inhibitor Icd-like protein [Escherichia coli]|nr:host cell division inhibitor Icd-like protein [Escherichia coli]